MSNDHTTAYQRRRQRAKNRTRNFHIICVIFVTVAAFALVSQIENYQERQRYPYGQPKAITGTISGQTPYQRAANTIRKKTTATVVTYQEYLAIEDGMKYERACEIIGQPGIEESRSTIDGVPGVMESITTVSYRWQNDDGSNMSAIFQNDRMEVKAQFGLP